MACRTTDAANDVGRKILLLRTVVFSVAPVSTVLADLILVVTQCTVKGSEFSQLVALVVILTFRSGRSLEKGTG